MPAHPPADPRSLSDEQARAAAGRDGLPFLEYRDGAGRRQLFQFASGVASAAVGRVPPADLLLDWDDQVSRLHARFERRADDWELVDDGLSSNGTFVNQERLSGRRALNDGDTLRFGTTTITFRAPARAQPGRADPSEPAVDVSSTQRRVLVALCRPYKGRSGFASPATDQQIAEDLFLSASVVRTHMTVLYAKFGVTGLAQNERRVRLAERAFSAGLVSEREL